MGRHVRFIHAADLHIGAPFRGLRALSDAWADRLVTAIVQAYEKLIDAAIEHDVDFVVIAGDIFDRARPTYADYRAFFNGLARLREAGISAYLCTGNHDPYSYWQKELFSLPDNAHMFSAVEPSFFLYERDGEPLCVLGGRGYLNKVWPHDENIAQGITRTAAIDALGASSAQAPFGVGVLHTGLDLDPIKAPTNRAELLAAGFDYWALGHIHKRYLDNPEHPRISFSGCIQGRDIKETGARGVNLVTLREGECSNVTFIPTAQVVYAQIPIDVSACVSIPEVSDLIMRESFNVNGAYHCEEMVSRITLVGSTQLHNTLARPGLLEDIRNGCNETYPELFIDALIDETTAPFDRDALLREGLFPSVLMKSADAMRRDREGTLAFVTDECLKQGIVASTTPIRDFDKMFDEAESLVLDLLVGSGDDATS